MQFWRFPCGPDPAYDGLHEKTHCRVIRRGESGRARGVRESHVGRPCRKEGGTSRQDKMLGVRRNGGGKIHGRAAPSRLRVPAGGSRRLLPPEFEGSHAKYVSKLDGIVRLRDESGGGTVSQGIKDDIVLFRDVGRIIAWAWLVRERYVETGR